MELRILFLVIITLVKYNSICAGITCSPTIKEAQPQIGLVISPAISLETINEIVIYWNDLNFRKGDVIILYNETVGGGLKPIYSVSLDSTSGSNPTGIQSEFIPSSNLTFVQQCLQYHVAWLSDGVVQMKNCIKTEPNWMHDRKDFLGPLIMSKVFIPGTHNAAAYTIHSRPGVENFIEKYAITQDMDILSQLIYGVRYLDMRIGHYPNTKEVWWTNHGIYRSVPFQRVVDHVKTFLDNTEEIVILDIQEFPVGFGSNITVHQNFVGHLKEQFAEYILPKNFGWITTLNTIWMTGKRLIIGYDNARVVAQYEHVWPCVTHQWGNVRTMKDLFEYLNRIERSFRGVNRLTPRSAMAQLTPNTFDVILNRLGGLRRMADSINLNVTNWYTTLWQDSANIVSVDFLKSTGIVRTAIEANDRRKLYCVSK